uniref:Peptidase C2 calpain domain-containing protein n=1 Tax=Romanomermis culicivorax TaxID=13658 RepID=A0A915IWF2_ROMCU
MNSGGNRSDLYSYSTNPQYLLTVYEPAEIKLLDPIDGSYFNEDYAASETTSVLISLMQEFRSKSPDSYVKLLNIGFAIYITADPQNRLPIEFFLYNHDVASTAVYPNSRQITKRFELEAGYYVFIPATYAKDQEGEFLIRAFSSKRISINKLSDHEGPPPQPVRQASHTSIVPPPVVHPAVVNNMEFQYDGGDWDPSTEMSSRRIRPI